MGCSNLVGLFYCKGGIKLILAITRENEKIIYEVCKENEFETPQVLTGVDSLKRFAIQELKNLNNYKQIIIDVDSTKESEEETMKVLGPNAEIQMELVGGERIFSRKNTKILLNLAKKAYKSKSETDYRILGRKVFKFLDIQDSNNPEYVEVPDKKE